MMLVSPDTALRAGPKCGFYIGVTCPGCGGDVELEDDFSVLTCAHCGSILRVLMPDQPPAFMIAPRTSEREIRFSIDRYLKERSLPLTASGAQFKYVLYPYWKVDAILLKVRNRIEERVVNPDDYEAREETYEKEETEITLAPHIVTVPAGITSVDVPDSVGVRARSLRMEPFSSDRIDRNYDALPVVRSLDSVWPRVSAGAASLNQISPAHFGKNRTELMHPVCSVVYFPYAIVESYASGGFARFTVDAVIGRVLRHAVTPAEADLPDADAVAVTEFGSLEVTFHRCENCGFDLPAERTFVAVCRNCGNVNLINAGGLHLDSIRVAESSKTAGCDFFPFWQFQIPSEDVAIQQLMGGLYHAGWLTVPGFRMTNHEAMYRLTKRLTAAMPQMTLTDLESTGDAFRPVSVSADDALTLAQVIIFRKRLTTNPAAVMGEVQLRAESARLIYVPFHSESYFCVDSVVSAVTFEKSAIR